MRDCTRCFNQRVLLNTFDVEVPCHACEEIFTSLIDASHALKLAQEAAEKFVRELGNRKAVS